MAGCPEAGVGGNSNGRLEEEGFAEASNLWAHLSAAQFVQGGYVGGATDATDYTSTAPRRAPVNAFNGRVLVTRTDEYESPGGTNAKRLGLVAGTFIPVQVARELDLKIADGLPHRGVLRSMLAVPANLDVIGARDPGCVQAGSPAIWDINTNAQSCNAMYLY